MLSRKAVVGDKAYSNFVATVSDIWQLNHCYARIRIISAYCIFLLKRANYYKDDNNRSNTVGFVKEQFHQMVQYKGQILEIEQKALDRSSAPYDSNSMEIKLLAAKLKDDLDAKMLAVAKRVGEKLSGETEANALEMTEQEFDTHVEHHHQVLRQW
jgi:hypothetical protein